MNFNIWVSCASLQGMLESLYRDIDVFILDRGIFDALVWNEWLLLTGKINAAEAAQVEQFFTMQRWTDLVDTVFIMRCEPSVSIEREYADQLTTKRGTIMAEGTLRQFLECVDRTHEKHGPKFKKVINIDTTHTETRKGVAQITDEALGAFEAFLDESLCVVPISAVDVGLPNAGLVSDRSIIDRFVGIVGKNKQFVPRSLAEQNPTLIQPIPCAVLRYEDKVLFLKRKKPGHALHDTYAVWAGGHVTSADDGPDILLRALSPGAD